MASTTVRAAGAPLFLVGEEVRSGSGWPSFWHPVSEDAIEAMRTFRTVCDG